MKEKVNPYTFINVLLFCFFGLSLVFPLGLLMLTIGPTRILAEKAANENWSQEKESLLQNIAISVFLVLVVLITFFAVKMYFKLQKATFKIMVLSVFALSFTVSMYIFTFRPELLVNSDATKIAFNTYENVEFHFGPYPDAEKIEKLKAQNYTAIITLLSSMVVPAEPILMEKEATSAKELGIKLISVPMLPWIDDNDISTQKIKTMARSLKGKYYVHCYLGKDRANVFRNIMENENSALKIESELGSNSIDTLKNFERGKIIKLKPQIYFTPFPTDDEFFGFILNGKIKNVVSIMDPATNNVHLEKEKKIMRQYNQKFASLPISLNSSDEEIESFVERIVKLKKPVLINSYSTKSELSERFIKIFKANTAQASR